jgi:hypothetical protein
VDQAHGSVNHDRTAVYGSMVDHGQRWPKGSPELALGVTPVSGSSPAVGEKENQASGVPTVGEGGRCGAGGRLATVDRNSGSFFSWTRSFGIEGNDEECGKGLWGRRGYCAAPFLGSRQKGERSGRESSGRW